MRTATTWHWWFPTYDVAVDKYSPGLLLLLEMARRASMKGVTRIDLGFGDARYKRAFANFATTLYVGSIEIGTSPAGALRQGPQGGTQDLRRAPASLGLPPPLLRSGPLSYERAMAGRAAGDPEGISHIWKASPPHLIVTIGRQPLRCSIPLLHRCL